MQAFVQKGHDMQLVACSPLEFFVGARTERTVLDQHGNVLLHRGQEVADVVQLNLLRLHKVVYLADGAANDGGREDLLGGEIAIRRQEHSFRTWLRKVNYLPLGQMVSRDELDAMALELIDMQRERGGEGLTAFEKVVAAPCSNYGVLHSLHAAYLCAMTAEVAGLDDDITLRTVQAALVMNVSIFELQDVLAQTQEHVAALDRIKIESHAEDSLEVLRKVSGLDSLVMAIVRRHHDVTLWDLETGHDLEPDVFLPLIVQMADRYAAMRSSRGTRQAMSADAALSSLRRSCRGSASHTVAEVFESIFSFTC